MSKGIDTKIIGLVCIVVVVFGVVAAAYFGGMLRFLSVPSEPPSATGITHSPSTIYNNGAEVKFTASNFYDGEGCTCWWRSNDPDGPTGWISTGSTGYWLWSYLTNQVGSHTVQFYAINDAGRTPVSGSFNDTFNVLVTPEYKTLTVTADPPSAVTSVSGGGNKAIGTPVSVSYSGLQQWYTPLGWHIGGIWRSFANPYNFAMLSTDTTVTARFQYNQAPIVAFSGNILSGTTPLSVTFNSVGTSDPEDTTCTYSWAFGDNTGSTVANPPAHTYNTGTYTVSLTVTDGGGRPTTLTKTNYITVNSATAPSCNFTPKDPSVILAGQSISFTATASAGTHGSIPSNGYHWSTNPSTTIGNTYTFYPTFPNSGTQRIYYTVSLYVTASDGTSSSPPVSTQVTVDPIDNKPTADFWIGLNADGSGSSTNDPNTKGGKIIYFFDKSTDDHGISAYSWAIILSSSTVFTSSLKNPSYLFPLPQSTSTYTVRLSVTDTGGQTCATPKDRLVTITTNSPPTASIGCDIPNPTQGQMVHFSSTISDPDTNPPQVTYTWNMGTGVSSSSGTNGPSPTATFSGNSVVTLTVTDQDGATSNTATQQITVQATGYEAIIPSGDLTVPSTARSMSMNIIIRNKLTHIAASGVSVKIIIPEIWWDNGQFSGGTGVIIWTSHSFTVPTQTDANGNITIPWITPDKSIYQSLKMPYKLQVSVDNDPIPCYNQPLNVVPPLKAEVDSTQTQSEQPYSLTGGQDLTVKGYCINQEDNSRINPIGSSHIAQIYEISPNSRTIPASYVSLNGRPVVDGTSFTVYGMIWKYYSDNGLTVQKRTFNVIITLVSSGYYSIPANVSITMVSPTVIIDIRIDSQVSKGTDKFEVYMQHNDRTAYKDIQIGEISVYVIFNDISTTVPQSSLIWTPDLGKLLVGYNFNTIGTYNIRVVVNAPRLDLINVESPTKTVTVVESILPQLPIDPLTLGGIIVGVIVLLLIASKAKGKKPQQIQY